MTLHGVRRWLRDEALPTQEKRLVLAEWLGVPPQRKVIREVILTFAKAHTESQG